MLQAEEIRIETALGPVIAALIGRKIKGSHIAKSINFKNQPQIAELFLFLVTLLFQLLGFFKTSRIQFPTQIIRD